MDRLTRTLALVAILSAIGTVSPLQAQVVTVLHGFTNGQDGGTPIGLAEDTAGNLYGVTRYGGNLECLGIDNQHVPCGVVFKLSDRTGSWVFQPIYDFEGTPDANRPLAGVIVGPDGALYGTTSQGGSGSCLGQSGCGTVFKLQPPANFCGGFSCAWRETILYNFSSRGDGFFPSGELVFDRAGNLYGTTADGGGGLGCPDDGCGTVFKLTHNSDGTWTKSTLYAFQGGTSDGSGPAAGVVMDQAGNLYGTTQLGGSGGLACGSAGCGTVFELTPNGSGWTETVLHSFTAQADSAVPGQLSLDSSGNLWGPTTLNVGTLFEVTPVQGGGWNFSTQYTFSGGYANPVIVDAAGNVYGTAGTYSGGVIYRLSPSGGGFSFTALFNFGFLHSEGIDPFGNIVFDAAGNIYGTNAGANPEPPDGTVWKFMP